MIRTLRLVLGDQLSPSVSSLDGIDPERDVVLFLEVAEEGTYVPHHKKKIALILSAMRHFAADLESDGYRVDYVKLDDPDNRGSFTEEVARAVERHKPARVAVTEPGEYRVLQAMRGWEARLGVPVEILDDSRFFASVRDFADWAEGRKQLRLEYFYREMRKRHRILMDGADPVGGQWNFDQDNRKRLPDEVFPPKSPAFAPDVITEEVLALVEERFGDHFGDLRPFDFAVTRAGARAALDDFVEKRLPRFGDYQDAMARGEDTLFHSVISIYLNIGLLDPKEACSAAEAAYRSGHAPLNAVEGFVRQILGWREYVRGLYWLKMPVYRYMNHLEASRPLPAFYWTGETDMACLGAAVDQTRRTAYAHHIQRLMVTGVFALLADVHPDAVNEWYLVVYADAFEWVELPNVTGMALFADGGIMASKPYAASGKYIDRMSDYCKGCRYDPKHATGPKACPYNFLYWDFLARQRERLKGNPRLGMIYRTLDRMDPGKVAAMRDQAQIFLDDLEKETRQWQSDQAPRKSGTFG
ncbi:MAG: cryptochrome/photolyase family protein [Alphaproteobacteria bacterium]|nr:cryptochrome/photolyase family protein [Alphaproteobacteria bacterium]